MKLFNVTYNQHICKAENVYQYNKQLDFNANNHRVTGLTLKDAKESFQLKYRKKPEHFKFTEIIVVDTAEFWAEILVVHWEKELSQLWNIAEMEFGMDRDTPENYSFVFRADDKNYRWNLTVNKNTLQINLV